MKSIRYRIVSRLLASLFVINLISGYYIYQDTQQEIAEIFNAEQAQIARTIDQLITDTSILDKQTTSITTVPDITDPANLSSLGQQYEKKIAYQVWDLEGNLLLMSENAPLQPLSATAPGFSRTEHNHEIWHIFSLYSNASKKWIYTAQKAEVRDELIELITQDQLVMMLVVNVLIMLVVIFSVVLATKPIAILGREINRRDGSNLGAISIPISSELLPIKNGVNRLLERIDETLKQEKSFSADLSHELRTPLAAIKIHAQNLELKEKLSEEGLLSVARMSHGVENMSNTIEQLLLLNSIDTHKRNLLREEFGLHDLAKEVLSLLPAAIHKKNDIELKGKNIYVTGSRSLISALLRNLIENASKYSDKASNIIVCVSAEENQAIVEVIDCGPGMTDEQKDNAIKRHYRISDTQAYGSGLGLAIAQKIIELHGGSLTFLDRDNKKGLVVRVSLQKLETSL